MNLRFWLWAALVLCTGTQALAFGESNVWNPRTRPGSGTGPVAGPTPAASVDNRLALWDGLTGRLLKDTSGITSPSSGQLLGVNRVQSATANDLDLRPGLGGDLLVEDSTGVDLFHVDSATTFASFFGSVQIDKGGDGSEAVTQFSGIAGDNSMRIVATTMAGALAVPRDTLSFYGPGSPALPSSVLAMRVSTVGATATGFMQGSHLRVTDGLAAPGATAGLSKIYVDSVTGRLTVKHGDGEVVDLQLSGDVVGPAGSDDFAVTFFDSTTGKLLQQDTGSTPIRRTAEGFLALHGIDFEDPANPGEFVRIYWDDNLSAFIPANNADWGYSTGVDFAQSFGDGNFAGNVVAQQRLISREVGLFNGETVEPTVYTGKIYSEDLTADMVFKGTSAQGAGTDYEFGRFTTDSGAVSALVVGKLRITDGITAPSTVAGKSQIYTDSGTGHLMVKHGDGEVVDLQGGGVNTDQENVAADSPVAVSATTGYYYGDLTSGPIEYDMESCGASTDGVEHHFKSKTGTNTITLDPNGTELIEGSSTSYTFSGALESRSFRCLGVGTSVGWWEF